MTPMIKKLACDYLIVGAGATTMAFIDTLLTQRPSTKVILVDRKERPGGHWNDAYGFVQLHQPSLLYGVASRQLEGSWTRLMLRHFTLPWQHRATKWEILDYFQSFVDDKVTDGQLEFFPKCTYDFDTGKPADGQSGPYTFTSMDGSTQYEVDVKTKFVNGILGECRVPSQTPLEFPVDEGINVMTSDDLYNTHLSDKTFSKDKKRHYVVLGMGKTGMDAVVYLQRTMKVKPDQISWVISNDVWMIAREGGGSPWSWPRALLKYDCDQDKAALDLESKGDFVRMDKNIKPTKFRFPVIGKDELRYMRKVKSLIRRGRVTAIKQHNHDKVHVEFGNSDKGTWIPNHDTKDIVFVHCASPGPFNENNPDRIFTSKNELDLYLLFAPPISGSMSVIAYLEAARQAGTLDMEFAQKLSMAKHGTVGPEQSLSADSSIQEILAEYFRPIQLSNEFDRTRQFIALVNLAMLLAIGDKDPMVVYKWMQGNRLTFLSIPGFQTGIYEDLGALIGKAKDFGYSEGDVKVFELIREKLSVLEGK